METASIIHDRVKELCQERKIAISQLEKNVGLGNGTVAKWGKSYTPSAEKVEAIAAFFGVSTDYLLGRTAIRDTMDKFAYDTEFASLQRAYIKLSPEDRTRMMNVIRAGFAEAFKD